MICRGFKFLLLAAAVLTGASGAIAQLNPTPQNNPQYPLQHPCMGQNGEAVSCQFNDIPSPDVTPPFQPAIPSNKAQVVTISPSSGGANGFPSNATPATGVGTGSTGAVTGTMAAVAGKTNYICNLQVSGVGGTAALGPITLTGLKGGNTLTYQLASSTGGSLLIVQFSPCFPASAVNTSISAATTADGTATGVDVNLTGYYQ
jgi:hypothetical protein